ncbi:MAG: DUF1592 domain-containing protein [Acidobacteriota bacterium]|nr:DUF1592 domain-containing protein [Acidobacteriota bacterium]
MLQRVEAGEMPPKGMPRPDAVQSAEFTRWIYYEFDRQDAHAKPDPGRITARRLNRAEYNNTIRDLLGVNFQPAGDFPQDDSGYGFDNIGDVLSVSPLLMEKYMAAAETVARAAVFGPQVKPSVTRFQPPNRRRLEKNSEKEILVAPLKVPAPYTLQDYDETGLGQPSSIHVHHRFPAEGDYEFHVAVGHNRLPGWDPLQMAVWIDGKIAGQTEISPDERTDVVLTGDRQAIRDYRLHVPAGEHWIAVTFLKQFEGAPAFYGAPNPTHRLQSAPVTVKLDPAKGTAKLSKPVLDTPDGIKVDWMTVAGPYNTAGPSQESLRKVFICGHLDGQHNASCDRKIVTDFARRAFRHPVTPEVADRYIKVITAARSRGRSEQAAVALAVQAMLVSPDFLFRIERDEKGAAAHRVSQFELASRLSYFLWSSMPDEGLFKCAESGALRQPEVLEAQVRRMLRDQKSQAFVENFAGQWLEIRRLESVRPDRERFPDFDDYLRLSMRRETELFFEHIMREDRPILDFLNADYTFMNERLARHYKLPGIRGPEFRKVDLTGTNRRGVMTQASVLTVSSYGNRTSPVLRGKWVLEDLLNTPPPPPPPDVPNLDTAAVGSTASLRQQLEEHRKNAVCASCHSKMDPLGFALENYDAVGQWRSMDGNIPIDASGTLPDGRSFRGAEELGTVLLQKPARFTESLTEKLLIYALGRGLERYDRPAVKSISARVAAHDYRFSSLVLGIVNSVPFEQRRGE